MGEEQMAVLMVAAEEDFIVKEETLMIILEVEAEDGLEKVELAEAEAEDMEMERVIQVKQDLEAEDVVVQLIQN